ncbi:uncharacterized protein LOC131327072 [Rhododendron vialii]|uniref:uncharacterized protein LOC131327072 n=1 Tax=Rhododendron vialii TaxID=182163 RepID=UPI00265E81AA|nr:uncharacterized protein LOC131327072 [Rhododendron vialii]
MRVCIYLNSESILSPPHFILLFSLSLSLSLSQEDLHCFRLPNRHSRVVFTLCGEIRRFSCLHEMDFFFRAMNEQSQPSHEDIIRCPFLRNINEHTNFSFSSSIAIPVPIQRAKGPIFEDGANFEMAFSLFHGQNGVVPLSGRSFVHSKKLESERAPPQFNPLAAKAATISLSGFGPFFGGFSGKWRRNQHRESKSSNKGNSSQGGDPKHESMSDDWLQNGDCPIARSYRAVSHILPIVAKALKPPPGLKLKCPQAIIAARAALSQTAFAKTLRPQPLPAKILAIGVLGMAANVPLGVWREHTEKFSPSWFAAVHAAVPFIAMLRKSVLMPKTAMAFTIAASVLGQVIGSRAERYRLKAVAERKLAVAEKSVICSNNQFELFGAKLALAENSISSDNQFPVLGARGGHCGEIVEWNAVSLKVAAPALSTDVCC